MTPSATSGLRYFSTGDSKIWMEKYRNPLVAEGKSVLFMSKTSKIFQSC
jgi:hypothetical protein